MTVAYYVEPEDLERLEAVKRRLYGDGVALTGDQQRDLANVLDALLHRIKQNPAQL